ncbi:MAG: class I SAM-dependent methyltransferase [Clostridiales bacterium]|jgi:SAM-dependent methyltransferase|nr:class I SAM-dependent methyltransferase [Clostridiales bacterium]
MNSQLEQVAKSYDRHFTEYGLKDNLTYDNLPDYITNDSDYAKWKAECEGTLIDPESVIDVKNYLSPDKGMKFIQLGCSVNLMNKGYDKWPSLYHGVDISRETINTLNRFVAKNGISVGGLRCASVHETPYDNNYFDIGECIGVLEYYEKPFLEIAIKEFYRIMRPDGKFVLDIPNTISPSGRIMMMIEECMGRPDRFNITPQAFEDMIREYFIIEQSNRAFAESKGYMGMIYCLRCKK